MDPRLLCPWSSPSENTGVGSYSLLQGIFPTQGSHLGLLLCRQILYCLSHHVCKCVCVISSTEHFFKLHPFLSHYTLPMGSGVEKWYLKGLSSPYSVNYLMSNRASLVAQLVKNPPAMPETWVQSLGWEDPLEKGKATHSSILARRITRSCKELDTTEWLSLQNQISTQAR